MRMWGINPKILCRKHLLGEHVEMHMFVGTINKGHSINGFIKNKLVNPALIKQRHDKLVKEMIRREYHHHSPLPKMKLKFVNSTLDMEFNKKDLFARCKECKQNNLLLKKKRRNI